MAQRIVIAGMRRSGTHWQYNLVRLALEALAPGQVWAGQYDAYQFEAHPEPWHLVKIHRHWPRLAAGALVLTSFRALPEVQASHARMTGRWPRLQEVSTWMVDLLKWHRQAVHCTWYAHIVEEPAREAQRLLRALGLPARDAEALVQRVEALRPPPGPPETQTRDPVTLLFQGHRTSQEPTP